MKTDQNQSISPAVHLEFIQNQAGLPDGAGLQQIEEYHRALFLHHHARDLERFQQEGRIHEDRLGHLEGKLKEAHARLGTTDKLIPVDVEGQPDIKPSSPWNLWDRLMFTGAFMAVVSLLVFGVFNISFNLLESGLVTFLENPIRAYFWAALLPVGALAVKVGWDFLQSRRLRTIYLWVCLFAGIAGVLVWVGAYASVYPTLSKSTREQIDSLSVFDDASKRGGSAVTPGGAKWVDAITVGAQAVAEVFLSAALGIYMTMLYARHRPVRLAANPLFTQLDEERRSLDEGVARERLALAEARGNELRLQHQLTALLAFARSIYQKETALRQDQSKQKQILLDQISEGLRTQLASVENGSGNNHKSHTLAYGRGTGA